MRLNKQMFLHSPVEGIYGDCYRTAISCILDKEVEEVPHFLFDNCDGTVFVGRVKEYLDSQGYQCISIPYSANPEDTMKTFGQINPDFAYLVSGMSARKVNHTVVARGTGYMHDTHPSDTYLIGVCDDGNTWIDLIVPKTKEKL